MSVIRDDVMDVVTIDAWRSMDPALRTELEILDDEIRSIVARMSARTVETGGDETLFSIWSSTVLLSIAAALTKKIDHPYGLIDTGSFLSQANEVAGWVNNRKTKYNRSCELIDVCF